jgi:biopolymer transport protein ExbB
MPQIIRSLRPRTSKVFTRLALCTLTVLGAGAAAQSQPNTGAPAAPSAAPGAGLDYSAYHLFRESVDPFTALLVLGSITSVAVILQCLWEVRGSRIVPQAPTATIRRLAKNGHWAELREFTTSEDDSFISQVVRAAIGSPGRDRVALRDGAEMAASEECARWFRKIEPLNIVGNLGPLLGLAGTVWGMIIAFTSLGEGGGQANPGTLALGISKALFHTLLGLLLAVPSLLVFGWYRTVIDRHCTRAMSIAAEVVEMLPESPDERIGNIVPAIGDGAASRAGERERSVPPRGAPAGVPRP